MNTKGDPNEYRQQNEPATKTTGGIIKTGKEWIDNIGDTISKMPIRKLFFILLILGYCVVAFSKGQWGVSFDDLCSYVVFIIFSLAVYMTLHFFEEKYGSEENKN